MTRAAGDESPHPAQEYQRYVIYRRASACQGRTPRPPRGHRPARAHRAHRRCATAWRCPTGCSAPTVASSTPISSLPADLRPGASVIRTSEDYRDITYEYLAGVARDGGIYVELTASPDHAALVGLSDEEHYRRDRRGDRRRAPRPGIEARILVSAVRNFGADQAIRVARHAAEPPAPVRRRLLDGRRRGELPGDRVRAGVQDRGRGGLGCTVHAGEWAGADSVRAALELPVTRISHGVRAIEDPALGRRDRRRGDRARHAAPPATSCSASTRAMSSTRSCHLRDEGVRVTLGSDDPPYFGATIAGEYEICAGADGAERATCARSR